MSTDDQKLISEIEKQFGIKFKLDPIKSIQKGKESSDRYWNSEKGKATKLRMKTRSKALRELSKKLKAK